MGTKHDILTEKEMAEFEIQPAIREVIADLPPGSAILDWGCGRGRSVARLREQGHEAHGVDIDPMPIRNGSSLLRDRGLDPNTVLHHLDEIAGLQDQQFDCIFSEEVLEHVADLPAVLREMRRLTKPGGVGIHVFPASRAIYEEHIHMPLVHWLPKRPVRKWLIALFLVLGFGPRSGWPETEGQGFWSRVAIFCDYLHRHTFYRDVNDICITARLYGFEAECEVSGASSRRKAILPPKLRRNGFPRGRVVLKLIAT